MSLKSFRQTVAALIITVLFFSACRNPGSVFEQLPSSATGIDFINKPEEHRAVGILYYLYYYNGGGVAVGDINNDGLPDIYFTASNHGGNRLYLNKGNFKFEDITDKSGVAGKADWCTGATMADVNGDGLLDIYVCAVQGEHQLKGRNELFINNGNNTFTESAEKYGLALVAYSTQAAFFDYDHDGDLDCFVLNQSHNPNQNIVDTSHRKEFDSNAGDRLYRNDINTAGKFTDVSATAGLYQSNLGYGLGIAVADMNNDGWDDIYIGNDFHENDYYYINNGNGSFIESGAKHFGHYSRFSMGNDVADYNNDGQPDVVTVDMLPPDEKTLKTYGSDESYEIYNFKIRSHGFQEQVSRNCLQKNNGDGKSFSDVALMTGISATDWSWAPLFADFDNDGYKDLFISSGIVKRPVDLDYVKFVSDLAARIDRNASDAYDKSTVEKMPDGASHPFLFKNNGNGSFSDASNDWGTGKMKGYFNGAAYADLNNDGKLDLVINNINAQASVLKNNAAANNYLSISFKGEGMNKFGVGAKAWVFTHTDSAGIKNTTMQYQQLMLTRGFQSSCDTRLYFGVDTNKTIDSVLIVWTNQQYQLIKNIPSSKPLIVEQNNAVDLFSYVKFFPPKKEILTDVTAQVNCEWRHREDNFNDFNVQYLIPHKESTRGPKIAVGDINKDGLDDFYACGAKGQPGALMQQQKDGTFKPVDTAVFNQDILHEDVDAVFFDANNDGLQDLLVISGGNEPQANSPVLLLDRLYFNNGNGTFTRDIKFMVDKMYNKSCVAVADVDHDGDSDIFIGTLASTLANDFGIHQNSFLLLNDGKGKFADADYATIKLLNLGVVTAASFADVNHDGWADLVVTGEWMPLKIFMNDHGKFKETGIANSTGLWQNVFVTDVNGDGNPDILAGNWGHNSKLWAGKTGPLKLYIKDFDLNGITDQVLCYTIDGKEYTFLAKDELEKDMPVLKKYYLTYSEVAGKTVDYMFYDLFKDYTELKAETLGSACFINDGKGNFKKSDLPDAIQQAPVFAFATLTNNAFITGGNFYGTIPYEGRYDALCPTIFSANKDRLTVSSILPDVKGEVRDIKWLRTVNNQKLLVLARNNDSLLFYKLNQ
ncbi:MAG TPA: VCBS repeat-containing protein [Parafilimonas sp.]|nr:VCBS repeat-containing protein [Parafilimonas sp.]